MKLLTIVFAVLILTGCQSGLPTINSDVKPVAETAPRGGGDAYNDPEIDLAPLLQIEDDEDHSRTRILGPFIEDKQDADGRRSMAVRPLFSRHEDFAREHIAQDILYPILTYRLNGIRLLQNGFIGISIDDDIYDENSSWQDYILPVYFNGRGKAGDRYFAIWPFGGVIRDVFSYSYIQFWLWPLYMKTIKSNDIVSYHVLWPILHKADGKFVKKRKVFPIIGYSEDYKKRWNTSFFLWPIVHWGYSLDQKKQPGWAFGIFPLASYATLEIPEKNFSFYSWNLLFPFFMHAISTNSKKIHAPWPFFQYMKETDSKGVVVGSRLYFWPLWGKDLKRGSKEWFFLYPLLFRYDRPIPDGRRKMTYVCIAFLHAEDQKKNGEWSKFTRLWPLVSYDRDSAGNRRLKLLDVFPLRNVHAIDRNWSPIWTLYDYQATAEWFSHEFLWGLVQFKKKRGGDVLDCSIFPLFNYEISGMKQIRKFSLLLGLYGSKAYDDGANDSQYLWLWKHRVKDSRVIAHGLFPLYDYKEERENQAGSFSLLTGLYSRARENQSMMYRYGWLLSREKLNNQTVAHGLFPFYHSRNGLDGGSRSFDILGGLWGKETRPDGTRLTRLFWFFRIQHDKPDLKNE